MSQNISDVIVKDHKEIFEYYEQYKKAEGDVDKQERWARQLIWEVARHSAGEEIVVYPLFEKYLGEKGLQMAEQDRAEHQAVKERLGKLETLPVGSSEHRSTLEAVMKELRVHMDSEEKDDLPTLEASLSSADSQETAKSFQRTKLFVPTRAHPSAPDQPPFETLAGFLALPTDKLKDMFSKFPTEEMREGVSA